MNKKLICLMLSILMLLSCLLTGCTPTKTDAEEGEESTVDNSAKTIVMWIIAGEGSDEVAQKAVSEAFTKITKAKFKTNVVLKFCTEEEYYEKLEAAIEEAQYDIEMQEKADKELRKYIKLHKDEGKDREELTKQFYIDFPEYAKYQKVEEEEDDENAKETEEETETNEYGITQLKYPEPKENQVDIFYLSGYERYMEYYSSEWLASLSEELSTSSKKLNDYISTSLLQGVQIEGGVYAIPNNVPIGEYTYMMIDKELFDKYYQKIDKVESVLDLNTFLNDIRNHNLDAGKTPEDEGYVVPLASTYQECLKMLCWYWDLNYVDKSVYDMYFDEETGRNYVVKKKYDKAVESTDKDGNTITTTKVAITNSVQPDLVYKTNADGEFVDENGNVLGYRYETDTTGGWVYDAKKNTYTKDTNQTSLYLVDKDGFTVTTENDRRVQIDAETSMDADGNTRPTYSYSFDKEADFSILGTMMKDAAKRNRGSINLGFNSLFTLPEYHNLYATLKDYDYQSYYGEVKEGQTAAVSFMKGDARIKQAYDKDGVYVGEDGKEYYVVVAEYPEATEQELYGNMFAVYANSNYLARSMEVITYLNTNKELRNLLQYGIEGQHYELVETEGENGQKEVTVRLLSNKQYGIYRMDLEKTGNCFIATPPESMGADAWTYAKIQNNDSLINPLLGFDFNTATADSDYSLDVTLIDYIDSLNKEALALIDECTNKADLIALMSDAQDGFIRKYAASSANTLLLKATNPAYDPEAPAGPDVPDQEPDLNGSSPYTIYQTWLTTYGYAYVPSTTD